ncbi:hypothetical protein Ahy_A08g038975 [Arachis hypogaea]|uniref:Aminotransferase-like plant mobile domain-containing protein n=1 Tax=Arachis hypogaea TaxID=3818 RepID=A0A445BUV5_ARAHY|nr:hypothetical protein Ahy_A08g038975 [Arachis hypogaea]
MLRKSKPRNVDLPELHVVKYLNYFDYVYVKCYIMLLIGTIVFGDKSGASVHWKFLPLLSDFASIGQYSWGSACLAHLYRSNSSNAGVIAPKDSMQYPDITYQVIPLICRHSLKMYDS